LTAARRWPRSRAAASNAPTCKDYAWRLWDYWERHLDPDLFIDRSCAARWRQGGAGHRRLVGIGLAAAHKFAEAGAITIICGRDQDKLDEACKEIRPSQGRQGLPASSPIRPTSPTWPTATAFVQLLIENHGGVDFLINNAGRSIRRAIENSYDRFHDFERTMQLNYFGCLRVTMGLLPGMVAKSARAMWSTSARSAC
jgi:NAD(P)-dependent dehydrogenase (short-subunit alcohol dehydrogenase family)